MALSGQLQAGDVLDGRYIIERLIGSGGMGEVYAARRVALSDLVAIKRLKLGASSPTNRSRFLVEARAAAHVRHPNVIQIFDFGESSDHLPYMVMELLEGEDLEARLRRTGAVDASRALSLFAPICSAVEAGHRRGVIHRDLKPANVFITTGDDRGESIKVLDFGLASVTDGGANDLTAAGTLLGTPRYMSPEQLSGQPVRPTSDVWALGVILYRLVTGHYPFNGPTPLAIMAQIVKAEYIAPRTHQPDLPHAVADAIARALTLNPDGRPRSPEQLARLAEAGMSSSLRARTYEPSLSSGAIPPSSDDPTRDIAPSEWTRRVVPQSPRLDHFTGRDQELAQLNSELAESLSGSARMAIIVGEPGIGKTRLVEHFVKAVDSDQRAVVLQGRFHDYAGSRPPAFETFLAMLEGTSAASLADATPLRQALAAAGHEVEGERWRVFQAVTEAFAARAGVRPLLLSFDDLQWANRAELDLIDHLHQTLGRRGTLVVATARKDEAAADASTELSRWLTLQGQRRAAAIIRVHAFSEEVARQWMDRTFGELRVHPSDLRRLLQTSGANPYALAELVRALVTSGTIHRTDDGWICQDLSAVDLPDTVQSLVRTRLDHLEPELRETLQVAAVIGMEIRFATLLRASGRTEEDLDDLVERAIELRLLREDGVSRGNDYRLESQVLRRMLYESIRRRARAAIHRSVVEALHELYGGSLDRLAPVLAYHYEAIGDSVAALRWGLTAGSSALDRFDNDAAATDLAIARRAADHLADQGTPSDAITSAQLVLAEGTVARRLGRLDAAVAVLRSLASTTVTEVAIDAALEMSRCELDRGNLEAAQRSAAAAVLAAGDRPSKRRAATLTEASALLRMGRAVEASERLDSLLAEMDDDTPAGLRSLAHRERAWAGIKLGRFAESEPHARRALDLARIGGNLLAEHHAVSALAALLGESGDQRAALPLHMRALELSRRLSLRRSEAIDLANIGETSWGIGELEVSLDHLRRGLAIFIEIGDRACEGDCRVNIGRVLRVAGQVDEAVAMLERGRAICESTGRIEYATLARLEQGQAHLDRGEADQAVAAFSAAEQACSDHNMPFRWQALAGRARALSVVGEHARARTDAKSALSDLEGSRGTLAPTADLTAFELDIGRLRAFLAELDG